jgi:RNA polymerase sigma-70 factor (ECF subfamily)
MLNVANHIVRNDADAQDCVQEAFLKVLKHIDQFEGRASVGSWLHKIVANTALMRLRSQVRKKEDSLSELLPEFNTEGDRVKMSPVMPGPSVQQSLQSIQTQTIVRQAIDHLPEPYRAVLIARDIEGFDTNETAEVLDLHPGAVKTRLHRARGALKTLLEPAIKAGIL